MDRIEIDRKTIDYLYRLYKKGRVNLQPVYQRGKVWMDGARHNLIDSIKEEFPIGLVMLNVDPRVEEGGIKIDRYDVVDGQQRLQTIFEYIDGKEGWAKSKKVENFMPFKELRDSFQTRFYEYQIPIAFMKDFEEDEISESYTRLQRGMALKIGEKLKAITAGKAYPFVKDLTRHKIFEIAHRAHEKRDSHWTLATAFFKSVYANDLFGRQEYHHLAKFMKERIDEKKAKKVLEKCRRLLHLEKRVLDEAIKQDKEFERYARTARTLKWLFVSLATLFETYGLHGREQLIAKGGLNYYKLIGTERSHEWTAYVNTGRTGRIDTNEVRHCLVDLTNQIIVASSAKPIDPNRFFTKDQRELIFKNSGGHCQKCRIPLTATNFHADHKKPHSANGPTIPSNGQALCSSCNWKKGSSWTELLGTGKPGR